MRRLAATAPGTVAVLAVIVTALAAGCAQRDLGTGGSPPKLHIGSGAGAAAGAIVPARGSASNGLAVFGGYVLAGALPDSPTHARVWRWTAGRPSESDVVKLGEALGVTGTPARHANGWLLTSNTGELRVRDGGGQWSYARADVVPCPPYGVDIDHTGSVGFGCAMASGGSAVAVPGSQGPSLPPSPPAGPDQAATLAAAQPLLAFLALDGSRRVDVGAGTSTLTVSPVVHSLPTEGIETRVDVDAHGIRSATGWRGVPAEGTDYPLRTAKAAFDDLANGPRPMIAQYCGPMPAPGGPESEAATTTPTPIPCPTPTPVKVTGASIGLDLAWEGTDGGSPLLVPAWFFTTEGSDTHDYPLAVVAIDPRFLAGPTGSEVPGSAVASSPALKPGW